MFPAFNTSLRKSTADITDFILWALMFKANMARFEINKDQAVPGKHPDIQMAPGARWNNNTSCWLQRWNKVKDDLYTALDHNKCPFDRWLDCSLTLLTRVSSKPSFEALLLLLSAQHYETIGLAEGGISGREASSLWSPLFILIALRTSFVLFPLSPSLSPSLTPFCLLMYSNQSLTGHWVLVEGGGGGAVVSRYPYGL